MARKKRSGRRGMLSKVGRKVGSFAGSAIQLLGVSHGLISGVTRAPLDSDTPKRVIYDYSGVRSDGSLDQTQLMKSATLIAVTFAVGWGIKQLARRM